MHGINNWHDKNLLENLITTGCTHIRDIRRAKRPPAGKREKGRKRENLDAEHIFEGRFRCSDVPRTSLTCFHRTFRSFLGSNCITFSQPLVSIYSLIACKIHAAESLAAAFHRPARHSGRNSDPLRVELRFPLSGGINLFGLILPSTPANFFLCTLLFTWRIDSAYFFFFE